MNALREELESLAAAWAHTGDTTPDPAGSVMLMHAHDLRSVLRKHFPPTTEPAPPLAPDSEPARSPRWPSQIPTGLDVTKETP